MDSHATFVKRFGDLVALLRVDPGNDAAQDLALAVAAQAVERVGVRVEAGVVRSEAADELGLRGRLLARGIDVLRVAAGADPAELLSVARALAHDVTPVAGTERIEVELIPLPVAVAEPAAPPLPPNRRGWAERRQGADRRRPGATRWVGSERRRGERRDRGERRTDLIELQRVTTARLLAELAEAARRSAAEEALAAAADLVRLAPRVPAAARRTFGIAVRRGLGRTTLDAIVALALRTPELREQAAEVSVWIGAEAADALLDQALAGVGGAESYVGETLGRIPAAYPLALALLRSPRPAEVVLAANLLARLGRADAVEPLVARLDAAHDGVRAAAVRALGALHGVPAAEGLRRALRHASATTRAEAAGAIARWRNGALAFLLVSALADERDTGVRAALIAALGRVGSAEACTALAAIAQRRRRLFGGGYPHEQRLAAVRALARSSSPAARTALDRVARHGDEAVAEMARDALGA